MFTVSFDTAYLQKIGKKHINKAPSPQVNQCSVPSQADQRVVGLLTSAEVNSFVSRCCLQNRRALSPTKGLFFFLSSLCFLPGFPLSLNSNDRLKIHHTDQDRFVWMKLKHCRQALMAIFLSEAILDYKQRGLRICFNFYIQIELAGYQI